MKRTLSIACLTVVLAGTLALGPLSPSVPVAATKSANSTGTVFVPAVAEWQFLSAGATPPTEAQCYAAARRCFTPQSMANSYNYAVLHAAGNQGQGVTIAVLDNERFGETGVMELTGTCGYYSLVAMVLNVDRQPLPEGAVPLEALS